MTLEQLQTVPEHIQKLKDNLPKEVIEKAQVWINLVIHTERKLDSQNQDHRVLRHLGFIADLYAQAYQAGRESVIEDIDAQLFMYTHQWAGDDKERACESCKQVVRKNSFCEASSGKTRAIYEILQELRQQIKQRK